VIIRFIAQQVNGDPCNAPQEHLHRGDTEAPRLIGAAGCLYQKLMSESLVESDAFQLPIRFLVEVETPM
jgi:hypothetical protein